MNVTKRDKCEVRSEEQVVKVRQLVRTWATEMGFSLVEMTKLVTAASELARNILVHGGGGEMELLQVEDGGRHGLRLVFSDHGPGIPDMELAMRDGYTTGSGLGLGLSGAKRLVNDFEVLSRPGEGTRVTITRWRSH